MPDGLTLPGWLANVLGWLRPRPQPAPVPAPRPTPWPTPAAMVGQMVGACNWCRLHAGLDPVTLDPTLQAMADGHAPAMAVAGEAVHDGLADGSFAARVLRYGLAGDAGECVAEGYPDAASVMAAWAADPAHRAILLGPYTGAGFAVAYGAGGVPYWCADFGGAP
jgi:uncharacterized protein YkwD